MAQLNDEVRPSGFSLLARAGIGFGLPWNLVIDTGTGITFAR